MMEFAKANGFDVTVEKDFDCEDENERILKKRAEIEKKIKEEKEKMLKETMITPPLAILRKKFTNDEPIRTGFNQALLPIKIKHN